MRTFAMAFALSLAAWSTPAAAANTCSLSSAIGSQGEEGVGFTVEISNDEDLVGLEFHVGFNGAHFAAKNAQASTHITDPSYLIANTPNPDELIVLVFDLGALAVIAEVGSGPVTTFEINIAETAPVGDHILELYGCVMSRSDGTGLTIESTSSGTLTVEAMSSDGGSTDTGAADDGGTDGGTDTGGTDDGCTDGGSTDTGAADGGGTDAGGTDDGGTGGGADTGTDGSGGTDDAGDDGFVDEPILEDDDKDGCACASGTAPGMGLGWLAVGLLGLIRRREGQA
jgi:MYXO-CTERM domain-containing protein